MEQNQSNLNKKCSFNLTDLKGLIRNINNNNKVKIDVSKTQYPVIRIVSFNHLNWKLWSKEDQKDEANIIWVDTYISEQYFRKLKPYQKINHFIGSYQLGKKNHLAINLMRLRKKLPAEYSFFPETWLLPRDMQQFKKTTKNNGYNGWYIAKPEAGSQGRGIYIFNTPQQLIPNQNVVVQQYIQKPFLIEGLKFDFRIYVLIKNLFPLKIFVYKQGLARLATFIYESPNPENIQNLTMHLTNYAINKKSPQFVFNNSETQDNIGHKRSYTSVMEVKQFLLKLLREMGQNIETLQLEIDQIIVKTILSAHPQMSNLYKECRGQSKQYSSLCFQILGFDIMIDHNFKPYLIEVNHSPSFTTDTPLDFIIKKNLILDTLNILNISHEEKKQFLKNKQLAPNEREKITIHSLKQNLIEEYEYENKHMGAYRRIYPVNNNEIMRIYSEIMNANSQYFRTLKKRSYASNSREPQKNNDFMDNSYYILKDLSPKIYQQRQLKKKEAIVREGLSLPVCSGRIEAQDYRDKIKQRFLDSRSISNKQSVKQKILKRNRLLQKKKFHQNLLPIKLKNAEIDFFSPGIYSNYSNIKPPYMNINMDQQISIDFSKNNKQDAHKIFRITKPNVFNLDKTIFKDQKGVLLQLKQSFYENINKFNPVKNWQHAPMLRFNKVKNPKNFTLNGSVKNMESESQQQSQNTAQAATFYGKL